MKFQSYEYQKGEVSLSFKFPENEKLEQNKKDFVELLKLAIEELTK